MLSTIVEFLFVLLVHAAVGIYSFTLKYSKLTTYIIWGIWVALQMALFLYTEFVITDIYLQFFVGFILPLLGQYTIFFITTKGKIAQRVFALLTYSIFFCIFMTLFTMIKGSFPEMNTVLLTCINGFILFCLMYCYIRYMCPLWISAVKNITTGWTLLVLIDVIFLIMVILSSVFPVRISNFYDPSVVTFIFISISIVVVYPIIFSNINSLAEVVNKREIEQQNQILLMQIEKENQRIVYTNRMMHDRRHHNLMLLEFANNNDLKSIKEYLKSIMDNESENAGDADFCDNITINTVLSVYRKKALEAGLSVKISAYTGYEISVQPQDLVIVIANLFENAIMATKKMKSKDKVIDIDIRGHEMRLLVKIENPCKTNMNFDETCYGVGLNSVINTVEKYDGMYDFCSEDGIFSAKVCLNF